MLESIIKSKSRTLLEDDGWIVVHLMQTNMNGIPDTLCLKSGKAIFIEFKQRGEDPEPLQEYRIRKLREAGFEVYVIDTVDDTKKLIERKRHHVTR